jgi:hypothetical protein
LSAGKPDLAKRTETRTWLRKARAIEALYSAIAADDSGDPGVGNRDPSE